MPQNHPVKQYKIKIKEVCKSVWVVFLNRNLVETFFTKHLPEYKNILQNDPENELSSCQAFTKKSKIKIKQVCKSV